jgi:hypothetical protein
LDQLLAPIALYPDALLSQILMAATYPLEVVEADRWVKQNPGLTGDRLEDALKEKSWDVSVKSLCLYPAVLATMSENLEQTEDLGDAFLSQQDQVMDTIQRLRARAKAQGNLTSTDRQRVVVEDEDIIIEPPAPDVVYVPAYDPCWAYGPWWYPTCIRPWFWYPRVVVGVGFFFGPRIFLGRLGHWCGFHWRSHAIFINVNRTVVINRIGVTRMHGGLENWHHDAFHRRGIAYRNEAVAQRFGQAPRPGVEARRSFRGFAPEPGRLDQGRSGGPGGGVQPRGEPGVRPQRREQPGRPEAPGGSQRFEQRRPEGFGPGTQERGGSGIGSPRFEQKGGSAFESLGRSGSEVRQQSDRGRESMGGSPRSFGGGAQRGGSSGGGSRGGGSRDAGGGGLRK